MILLDRKDYRKILEPLKQIQANHYFARFVAENQVAGTIYVNHAELPDTCYIVHPYGMSLLFGNTEHSDFNRWLEAYLLNTHQQRSQVEWLQAYPQAWNSKISQILDNKLVKINTAADLSTQKMIEEHTRVNFGFNPEKFNCFRQALAACQYPIVPTDATLFSRMKGSVVPQRFWNSTEDFLAKGIGFSVVVDDEPVSTAYSAYIFEGILELGIETASAYRGKGLAQWACAELITYCMENHYEPVWSCRLENTGSYLLAQKLGFEPVLTLPFYRLPV